MFKLSKTSVKRLGTCHSKLQNLVQEAIKDSPVDFSVICGFRSKEEQDKARAEGKSKLKWPSSLHNRYPSRAVDIVPFVNGELIWDGKHPSYKQVSGHLKAKAEALGIALEWGGDWRGGWDKPHYQLAKGEQ